MELRAEEELCTSEVLGVSILDSSENGGGGTVRAAAAAAEVAADRDDAAADGDAP